MKKLLLLLVSTLMMAQLALASFTPETDKPSKAERKKQELFMMKMIAKLDVKQYETLRGKKMNFFEKISFNVAKKKLKKKLAKQLKEPTGESSSGFNVGGFLLGLILGLLGVLGAYLFSKDRNLRKWTWIGWGAWVVILLVLVAAGA